MGSLLASSHLEVSDDEAEDGAWLKIKKINDTNYIFIYENVSVSW